MNKKKNGLPIILLVSERSGSNLFRTLLGNHKEICAPVAPHFMAEFYNLRKYYGDLRIEKNSSKLITDMVEIANHPYHDWKLNLDIKNILKNTNSIVSAFHNLYAEKAQQEQKIHYCSKGVHSFDFVDVFRAELDNVRFIHLVRDPRDHVASWMKRPLHLLTPYDAILKWKSEQETFIDAIISKGLSCISIRYEDLISDTSYSMTKVLEHLGLEVDPSCFQTDKGNEESKRNPYWQNLSKPIMKNNKGKYKDQLSEEDILLIETIVKREMEFFGYESITKADWTPPSDFPAELRKKRKKKRIELSQKSKEDMSSLFDKLRTAKEIKQKRKLEWEATHPSFSIDSENKSPSYSRIKKRLKYLSYGTIGKESTQKLVKRFR